MLQAQAAAATAPPAQPRRRLRWLALLLAPLLSLLLIEGGLRLAHGRGALDGWLYMSGVRTEFSSHASLAELLEHHHKAFPPLLATGDIRLNSKGLRTAEYTQAKPPGTRRIVVLGDSHSWRSGGMPFASLWHSRLASLLQAEDGLCPGQPLEVINLAIPAIGPDFELRMWELEGAKLDADLVVLAISIGNDFMDVRGDLADETSMDRWARKVYIVRLWRNYWRLRGADQPVLAQAQPLQEASETRLARRVNYDRDRPKYTPSVHRKILGRRLVNVRRTDRHRFPQAALRMASILDSLHADIERRGARLALLLIPDEYQLDPELFAQLVQDAGDDPQDYELERPQRVLRQIAEDHGFACVDPLEAMRAAVGQHPLFNRRELHLNDLGHDLAARALAEAIETQGLLP